MLRHSLKIGAISLAICLSIAGCSADSNKNSKPSASDTVASQVDTTGTHKVTDHGERTVEVPNKIEKVALEQIPLMSTFVAFHDGKAPGLIGGSKRLVNEMGDTILAEKVPEALQIDTSFDDSGVPNAEALAALKTDIVFNNAFNKKNGEIIDSVGLTRVGFKTMGAPTQTYVEWFKLLEDVYGTPGKTDKKIEAGQKLVSDAQSRVGKVAENNKRSVMIVMGSKQGNLLVAGGRPGWFTDSWAKTMNFTNVTAETKQPNMAVNAEQIAAWNPDVILVTGKGMSSMTAKEILNNEIEGLDLSGITAVKNRKVYATQLGMWNWFTPNPDAPVVANWMGQKIYPEEFADVDLVKMVQEHYKTTYGWDITEKEANKILDPDA